MDFSNQEKLLYLDKLQFSKKLRWLFTIGVLTIGFDGFGQRNNVWLLETRFPPNEYTDSSYCLDFNYCPPQIRKIFLEKDKSVNKINFSYSSLYNPFLVNSFCDTSGQLAFTETLGQHYYNKAGLIYDSSYINNSRYQYINFIYGLFLSNQKSTYYFKVFNKIKQLKEFDSDSLLIFMSEFDNGGTLLIKNRLIYKMAININIETNGIYHLLYGKKLDADNIELILITNSIKGTVKNYILNYNIKLGTTILQKNLDKDEIYWLQYSNRGNKIAVPDKVGFSIYENVNKTEYQKTSIINLANYTAPHKKIKLTSAFDFWFSPNDSLLYIAVEARKDTTIITTLMKEYLLVINLSKPYTDYKIYTIWELTNDNTDTKYGCLLKLGPDGNIYGGSGGKVNGRYRILHTNNLKALKFEWLEDIGAKFRYSHNYSLLIRTLEDYKKTEFIWQPTCDSLKVRFTNTCDTQYFKRYRLFFDNGDSINLDKNWNTKIYNYPNKGKYFVRLKAFSKIGGFIWYGDSIEINNPPIAKFGIQKTKGCQWIGYGFTDSSQLFSIKPGFKPYKHWLFGDGKDSIDASTNPKLTYTYTTSNTFTVKLVVNNGYCTDTAIQINNVVILPAPKPGIIAAPVEGCTPLKVNFSYKFADVLDSAIWRSGFAASPNSYKGISGNFNYPQSGNFFLSQKLYGPSGCITADSVLIKVNPGISGMPDILNATVTNETSIDLKWKKHLNAVSYSVVKNNSFLAWTPDTTYTDKTANTLMANSYTVKAISMCNDSTTIQDLAQTIYLQATRTDNNEAQLNWTAYQRWEFGVSTYQLFSQNEAGYFELLATINGQTLDYLDEGFAGLSQSQRCYKIITDEKDGNMQLSASNVYCLPLKPVLFIPSAFSPNGDGVNDTWKINYKGIKEAKIIIFNRWGEIIFKSTAEKPEWDAIYKGLPVPIGAYFYQIEATGLTVGKVYKSGLVEVVR